MVVVGAPSVAGRSQPALGVRVQAHDSTRVPVRERTESLRVGPVSGPSRNWRLVSPDISFSLFGAST